jgi:hypothetical protein
VNLIEEIVKHPTVSRAMMTHNPEELELYSGLESLVKLRKARRDVKRSQTNARIDACQTGRARHEPPPMPGLRLLTVALHNGLPPDLSNLVQEYIQTESDSRGVKEPSMHRSVDFCTAAFAVVFVLFLSSLALIQSYYGGF